MDRRERTTGGGGLVASCLAVGLGAALLLAAHAPFFEPTRLHIVDNFVDQAQYITSARILADSGELRSGLIYPAFVESPEWRPYMPGTYLPLAASYLLLGYGVFTSLLPNLLAYVAATVGVFLIGNRLYGRWPGALAALLYALFPANLNYAFTAMAEQTFSAVCVFAIAAFLHLPRGVRPFAGPVLLAAAFLVRESAALYVLPMLAVLAHPRTGPPRRLLSALGVLAASVAILFLLNRWQIESGKGAYPLTWITEGRFNYADAFVDSSPDLSAREWCGELAGNLKRNLRVHRHNQARYGLGFPVGGFWIILSGAVLAAGAGIVRWRRDPFLIGAGALGLCSIALVFLVYDVKNQKALRSSMFTYPMIAVALAGLVPLRALATAWSRSFLAKAAAGAVVAGLLAWNLVQTVQAAKLLKTNTRVPDTAIEAIQLLGHDPQKLLVAPLEIMMAYAVRYYPVPVAFPPVNEGTFRLIMQRHEIGTFVLLSGSSTHITEEFLTGFGFERIGLIRSMDEYDGPKVPTRVYHVYRRP